MSAADVPTAREIARRYYGEAPDHELSAPPTMNKALLTPSVSHVVMRARTFCGSEALLSEGSSDDSLKELVRQVETAEGESLTAREREHAVQALRSVQNQFGPLTSLITSTEVNDIIIRRFDDVSVQVNRRNVQTDLAFPDHESYVSFIESLLARVGKACTTAQPIVDAMVAPAVRACVTHESFSPSGSGPLCTLRIARHRSVSLAGLGAAGLAPLPLLEYLAEIVGRGATTVLLSGEVGSGKTTLGGALAQAVPEPEAILVIEDTHELVLNRRFVRTLLTREMNSEGAGRITPAQAIRAGFRMAMNRIILGEMRDPDAATAFVDAAASGHPGLSTIHARSARDALNRLELFLSRAQPGVGMESVRHQIAQAVGVIVHLEMDQRNGRRRIAEIAEVAPFAEGVIQLAFIARLDRMADEPRWTREHGISRFAVAAGASQALPPPGAQISLDDPEKL